MIPRLRNLEKVLAVKKKEDDPWAGFGSTFDKPSKVKTKTTPARQPSVKKEVEEPNWLKAKALIDAAKAATGNKAATAKIKAMVIKLAKITPQSHVKTAMALDTVATRLDMEPLTFADEPSSEPKVEIKKQELQPHDEPNLLMQKFAPKPKVTDSTRVKPKDVEREWQVDYDQSRTGDDRVKKQYLLEHWHVYNKSRFRGKMKPAKEIVITQGDVETFHTRADWTNSSRRFRFSKNLWGPDNSEQLDETILHEMCHQYCAEVLDLPLEGHGPVWKRTMVQIGLPPLQYDYKANDTYKNEQQQTQTNRTLLDVELEAFRATHTHVLRPIYGNLVCVPFSKGKGRDARLDVHYGVIGKQSAVRVYDVWMLDVTGRIFPAPVGLSHMYEITDPKMIEKTKAEVLKQFLAKK